LVSNAIKFHREGVTPEVSIDATVVEHRVCLTVRDNGIGFEPQYSRRIFRVFERLHGRSEYPGTGIGLALCRRIAERHGGAITADSEPGAGAAFTVAVGDHLLVALAGRIAGVLRPCDTVARIGGDEFTILLDGAVTGGEAAIVAPASPCSTRACTAGGRPAGARSRRSTSFPSRRKRA
jgi:histidine kinase/DNA gyrase B/HSP90-like ATPase/diguanylate cyclase with GGDEF domain